MSVNDCALERHSQIMSALEHVKSLHEPARGSGEVDQQVVSTSQKIENDGCRQIDNIREAQILRTELKEIDSAIVKTKKETLTLYQSANTGSEISRVSNEQ